MPIYEYECDGCHSVFEVRQKVSDPAPEQHSCGSTQVRRILSATSFVLKGTGWYATDYGNRKDAPQGKESTVAPKADAKPDTKSQANQHKSADKAASGDTKASSGPQKAAKP